MLAPAIVESRIIPNGVDLSIFRPTNRKAARELIAIPQGVSVVLFVASNVRQNRWKDYKTIHSAIKLIAERLHRKVLFIGLGEDAPAKRIGEVELRFCRYEKNPEIVARYYQAADLYLHAALADTFPNTIIEALACGIPVVATAVGGIPEQVKGLQISNSGFRTSTFRIPHLDSNRHAGEDPTGILVPPRNAEAMADAIISLLNNDTLRSRLGENAANDARERFDLQQQVSRYLEWYQTIIENWNAEPSAPYRPSNSFNLLSSNLRRYAHVSTQGH